MSDNIVVENLHVSDIRLNPESLVPYRSMNIQVKYNIEAFLDTRCIDGKENRITSEIAKVIEKEIEKAVTFLPDATDHTTKITITIGDIPPSNKQLRWHNVK